ncbi:Linoleate 13S-lipoxygenase 3-1, chloroplastic [Glycine soja]|uniref:Linoleate 13S-lipoxygenase 3-1, chloroplastic n=1 Tax=Glycine soja TaxID=3848 RepID=A0A445F0Q7_GLYSO|nr:Linoleate 13S-lipoxygenase 3-1, chloroplastic [Glycine soja]
MSVTDMHAESRVEMPLPMYVPRDEQFDESKLNTFVIKRLKAVVHNLIPGLKASLSANNHDFNRFSDIDDLYSEGLPLQDEILKKIPFLQVLTKIQECGQGLLKYDTPKIISKDKFAWLRDDEFARQAIAGVNLEIVENKLFMANYHDVYVPFLDGINALDGRKSYATRTIFFLTLLGTLKPIAIELSLRPSSKWKHVVTPPMDATTNWKWQLAKAHVCANDAGVHQLVNHWSPYVVARGPQVYTSNLSNNWYQSRWFKLVTGSDEYASIAGVLLESPQQLVSEPMVQVGDWLRRVCKYRR